MTNEEIGDIYAKPQKNYISFNEALNLARQDEREKMTQEKFAEYFNSLKGGEVASAILTQLLRKGVTDDDLRGLRLQWIKDKPEKMQGVDVWVSWDSRLMDEPYITPTEPKLKEVNDVKIYNFTSEDYTPCPYWLSELIGFQKGQCKKFRIVEVLP